MEPKDRDRSTRAERRRLTHIDRGGRPRMVDVTEKAVTARRAVAEALVTMGHETLRLVIDGETEKGDVLTVAELAGVMAGKRTSELVPLCHPIPLTDLLVSATPDRTASGIRIRVEAATTAQTGVEMEALTAASIAALTVYDMVKGVERGAEIRHIRLLSKTGGKSGDWHRPADAPEEAGAAVKPRAVRARPVAQTKRSVDGPPGGTAGRATTLKRPGGRDA